jgi:hypothetical protein
VEDECNGLYTYDRKVRKVDAEAMVRLAQRLQAELERPETVLTQYRA